MFIRVVSFVCLGIAIGCSPSQSPIQPGDMATAGAGGGGGSGGSGGAGGMGGSGGSGGVGPSSLSIMPNPATVTVTVTDDSVATTPLDFVAVDEHGQPFAASWSIDRGELGTLVDATGVFTANGRNAGSATVTATAGSVQATVTLTVNVVATRHGAGAGSGTGPQVPDGSGNPPTGGYNGVGGVPLGPSPPPDTITQLQNGSGSDVTFRFLYPYDKTVFPRGMLPPLLQWSAPAGYKASAISVHIKGAHYDFTGFYAGSALINAPVDAVAWGAATNAAGADPITVELKVTDGSRVLGPLAMTWKIAPSRLRGSVYYNTYDSKLNGGATNGSDGNGSVLVIKPGDFKPDLAVPALKGKCHACHEVSRDGSTLFTATSVSEDIGDIYNLTTSPATPIAYANGKSYSSGMFTYGGVYPDGSMVLLSSKEDYHSWPNNSDLRSPLNQGTPTVVSGFANVISRAVTPAFAPDGRMVAFNFWAGSGANGVTAGNGRTLATMSFDCNAPQSSIQCGAPPYNFGGLRQLYQAPSGHYVGWPSFTPDGKMILFQHTTNPSGDGGSVLNTRNDARAEIWLADASATARFDPQSLCALNGYDPNDCKTAYLPTSTSNHTNDVQLNFEPNVTPIASGGYFWVVFTSRRLYGNVATTDPYFPKQSSGDVVVSPPAKKLWMAAIDPNPKAGQDPSHPAFYLPGQEIMSGNMRAYWVNEPCHPSGSDCQTGDECCTGYCSANTSGKLVCGDKPAGCVPEFGKCNVDTDCCGSGDLVCIDQVCTIVPIS
jgi:hypothetical protein